MDGGYYSFSENGKLLTAQLSYDVFQDLKYSKRISSYNKTGELNHEIINKSTAVFMFNLHFTKAKSTLHTEITFRFNLSFPGVKFKQTIITSLST